MPDGTPTPTPIAVEFLAVVWADGMGDDAEVPESAALVEAAMLGDIWVLDDELVLDNELVLEEALRIEVDVSSWTFDEGA